MIMWLLYDLLIRVYGCSIRLAAPFSPKAKAWLTGRTLNTKHQTPNTKHATFEATAWFHCASLGEFEQGRPVIEAFRKSHPGWKILLTFFSPSGYDVRKDYQGADQVSYLPLDTRRNAEHFVSAVNPALVVFVKYEFWFRIMDVLHRRKIPLYIISAHFRPQQHFFRWYGAWTRKQLKKAARIYVQHEESAALLRKYGIGQVTVSGDTRFDRVASIAQNANAFPPVEKFCAGRQVFLAGSTWPADEALILDLIRKNEGRMKFIIAPHEVGKERVEALRLAVGRVLLAVDQEPSKMNQGEGNLEPGTWNLESETILFSELTEENADAARVLIIDGIGYLSHLYQYAKIAYIGGGFGAGIHNILEAATFGKPVIFGPKYQKFREAVELVDAGGAFTISDPEELNHRTSMLISNTREYQNASRICFEYVRSRTGATAIILSGISEIARNKG